MVTRVLPLLYFVGNPVLHWLVRRASERAASGLRPRTYIAYKRGFQLFIAFMVYTSLQNAMIAAFFEYLICNNLSGPSLHNYVSILYHFFCMYGWPTAALHSRKIKLMIKSVLTNNPLKPKVKGVLSVTNLKQLISVMNTAGEQLVFKVLFLLGFFGFFRLATLVPSKVVEFDVT